MSEGTTRIDMSFPVDAVAAHPDMFKGDAPAFYKGIPIRRDVTLPPNEIHITRGIG